MVDTKQEERAQIFPNLDQINQSLDHDRWDETTTADAGDDLEIGTHIVCSGSTKSACLAVLASGAAQDVVHQVDHACLYVGAGPSREPVAARKKRRHQHRGSTASRLPQRGLGTIAVGAGRQPQ
jgi:hypothetical protein